MTKTIIKTSTTGAFQLVQADNDTETAFIVEHYPARSTNPMMVARVTDSHFCSADSLGRAVAETWASFCWR